MRKVIIFSMVLALLGCDEDSDKIENSITATEQACEGYELINPTSGYVIDGDTLSITTNTGITEKVRLIGIDAPELSQEYGQQSKEQLETCIADKSLTIQWVERNMYDSLLGKVIAGNTDCNLSQVETGSAWHYKAYQDDQTAYDKAVYNNAEIYARRDQLGLWVNSNPQAPWDYRKDVTSINSFSDTIIPITGLTCSSTEVSHTFTFDDPKLSNTVTETNSALNGTNPISNPALVITEVFTITNTNSSNVTSTIYGDSNSFHIP